MSKASKAAATVCVLIAATLSTSSTSLGTPAQAIDCFGLAPTIVGSEGDDSLPGTAGNDVIVGLGGDDVIGGFGGDDALCGGPGNDGFAPGAGDDRVDAGGGGIGIGFLELVSYVDAPGPVSADLSAGTATGDGTDTLVNVTSVSGSRFGDLLAGDSGFNSFFPDLGDDVVNGRAGDDHVGFDYAVQASLVTGSAVGEGSDRLTSVELLSGSDFDDVLTGNNGRNYLAGGRGNDVVDGLGGPDRVFGDEDNDRVLGGSGDDVVGGDAATDRVLGGAGNDKLFGGEGADALEGGGGFDTVSYRGSTAGVQVNLLVGRASGQGVDELAAVESVDGSRVRDRVLGDGRTNFLFGSGGVDKISGGADSDFLEGGARASSLTGGTGRDYCVNGAGAKRCEITGAPRIPAIPDQPPAARFTSGVSEVTGAPGIVMPLPSGFRSRLTASRTSALEAFGFEDEPASPSAPWSLTSPLLNLFESGTSAETRPFRYAGQPSCYTTKRPYRVTVGPPEQLEPAIADDAREQAFWRGLLFRQAGSNGKLVRVRATPWLVGVVQGPGVRTGFPVWTDAAETRFYQSLSFTVPAGTYTWAGVIEWVRTGRRAKHHIAPHIVQGRKTQPDKSCTFG